MVKDLKVLDEIELESIMNGVCSDCPERDENCYYEDLDCVGLLMREEYLDDYDWSKA
jgi:hypothetical protein